MVEQNSDFYQNLRDKFRKWTASDEGKTNKWAEYLLFAPDAVVAMLATTNINRRQIASR